MRFDAFGALNEIKNEQPNLSKIADFVLQLTTNILIDSVPPYQCDHSQSS